MSKVLVTGVNGFVGQHLTNELVAQGYAVVGVGRDKTIDESLASNLETYIQCDVTDYQAVKLLPLSQAKAVINLAGLAAVGPSFDSPELYMHVNTGVIDTLCRAVIQQDLHDMRIVAVSSGAVYSSQQSMPLTESSALDPDSSPYAKSKIAMENLGLSYRAKGVDCVVTRPFNHIGPGQGEGFLLPDLYKRVIEAQRNNSQLTVGNLTTRRDYTDVRDVAKAYVSLITEDNLQADILNVCSGQSLSGEEILTLLLDVLGLSGMRYEVDKELFRPSDSPVLYGDNSQLHAQTGWKPSIGIAQTITDFVSSQSSKNT